MKRHLGLPSTPGVRWIVSSTTRPLSSDLYWYLQPVFSAFSIANLRSLNILIPGGILQAVLCFGDQGGLPDHAPRLHQRTDHLPIAIAFDARVSCSRSMTMLFFVYRLICRPMLSSISKSTSSGRWRTISKSLLASGSSSVSFRS